MTALYPDDLILAPADALRPGVIDGLNTILEGAGLGRPLGTPSGAGTHELVELPLAGAGPVAVRDALRRAARDRGLDLPELRPDVQLTAGTVEDRARPVDLVGGWPELTASGKKTGFGTVGWEAVPADRMPPPPAVPPGSDRPVVAVLDTGVHEHSWLTEASAGEPFWEDAGWHPRREILPPSPGPLGQNFGSHYGHATFIAGRIRLLAPAAKLLSVRVMSDAGKVSEVNAIAALNWLSAQIASGRRVDVVLMAFGGPRADDEDPGQFADLRSAVDALGQRGVRVVAAAGNGGGTAPVYPAAFAADRGSPVTSVGAGVSEVDRAPFSNHGPWVTAWRPGTDVLSIMPLQPLTALDSNGFAKWSGNSFSAADLAGELAAQR